MMEAATTDTVVLYFDPASTAHTAVWPQAQIIREALPSWRSPRTEALRCGWESPDPAPRIHRDASPRPLVPRRASFQVRHRSRQVRLYVGLR